MRIFLIFLLLPLEVFSQDLDGVWTGTIYNDTTRKYIPYEIAITENKGKLTGFSHTIFTGNSTPETGVKSLKIKKKGGKILIEDDDLIYNNYTDPPPKGVRQYSVLNLSSGPSGEYLTGVFNTNRTREYASATGTINLQKKEKISETKLIPKLDDLKLLKSLSFIQPKQEEKKDGAIISRIERENEESAQQPTEAAINLPTATSASGARDYKVDVIAAEDVARVKQQEQSVKEESAVKKAELVSAQESIVVTPEIKTAPVVQPKKEVVLTLGKEQKKEEPAPSAKEKTIDAALHPKVSNTVTTKPALHPKQPAVSQASVQKPTSTSAVKDNAKVIAAAPAKASNAVPNKKPVEQLKENPVPQPLVQKPTTTSAVKENPRVIGVIPGGTQHAAPLSGPVVSSEELAKRKIETIRTVDFKADSIVLTLYDNGVIDGDTVSVILNGKTIISKEMLTTNALTKTVYITPELGDSLQLIMYAENLGSIAPNTGLLIIQDGEEQYQIRFAGDLQKNSAIILRRKRN